MQRDGNTSAQQTHPDSGTRFMRRTIAVAMAAGLVAIAGLSLSGTVTASNDDVARGCHLGTLKGRYLFDFSGTLAPPAVGVTQPVASKAAGVHLFNGDGTGTDTVTFTIGGQVALENVVSPISYVVNADCTGSYTVLDGPAFDLFIAPDGEQFAIIATAPPGNAVASIDRRVSRK
jgi:hypothetical protein